MLRGSRCFGGALLAGLAALLFGLQQSGQVDLLAWFRSTAPLDDSFQRGFRSDAMARINQLRLAGKMDRVAGDEELQSLLLDHVSHHPHPVDLQLDGVFDAVQDHFPGAQYLAANLITSKDREALLAQLAQWTAAANPEFDTINTAVFRAGGKLGVLGVMSRRIPAFTLSEANSRGGRFFNRCPHCGEVHALEIERGGRTLILSCPYCDRPFDILAADTSGAIRRAPAFLEGFELPETSGTGKTPEQRIVALWRQVADRCDYQLDQDRSNEREVWKEPRETWNERAGDCEDTAILLADVLLSAGFEARVAIGWNGNIGQHAWVVVRAGGRQYVIESTLQSDITEDSLAAVEEAAPFYQPEQLFDREHLYYTMARPERFREDYFSRELWRAVEVASGPSSPRLSLR